MCIRDSVDRMRGQPDQHAHAGEQQGGEAEQSEAFEEGLLCLLYTSDAADERSSVDLGGRRIIKKKNTSILTKQ